MNNAVLGAVNRRGRVMISSIHDPCLALRRTCFIDDSDSLTTLIAHYEAYILRSGDFRADDNDNNDDDNRQTNRLLYLLHMRKG